MMQNDDELRAFLRKTRGCALIPALMALAIGGVMMLALLGCLVMLFIATIAR
jgi:hypothetical protein